MGEATGDPGGGAAADGGPSTARQPSDAPIPGRKPVLVPPGGHGDDGVAVAAALGIPVDDLLDLAQTLNPVAPDVRPLLRTQLDVVRHYPDVSTARRELAAALGVGVDQVLLTNGGAEAIALVAALRPVGDVVEPEFSLYRRHLAEVSASGGRWRSNPNNPSGELAAPEEQASVWDEAFYPLATGSWTRGDALGRGRAADGRPLDHRPVALGSLTKLFACPGLRLGYLVAEPEVVAAAAALQPRWSVNALAATVLPRLLERCDLAAWRDEVAALRRDLTSVLQHCGLTVRSAAAPWVLVEGVADLRARLIPHGVLVRDCASFGMPGVHRVAVPGATGLERLAEVLPRALT